MAVSFEWSRVAFSRYGIKNKKSVGFSSGLKYFQSYLLRSFRSVCEGGRKAGLFPRVSVGNEVLRNTWLDLAFYDPCNVTRILRIWFPPSIFHRDQSMMRCLADWTSCCRYLCSSLLRSGEIKKRNKIYNPRNEMADTISTNEAPPSWRKRRVNAFNFHPRRSIFQVF